MRQEERGRGDGRFDNPADCGQTGVKIKDGTMPCEKVLVGGLTWAGVRYTKGGRLTNPSHREWLGAQVDKTYRGVGENPPGKMGRKLPEISVSPGPPRDAARPPVSRIRHPKVQYSLASRKVLRLAAPGRRGCREECTAARARGMRLASEHGL